MRYAIYFSPAKDHPLTEAASRWLGRDAFSGTLHDDHDSYAEMTEEPRRYGFHATLKAPFELAEKYSEADLITALEDFAASQSAFDVPRIVVGALGPFLRWSLTASISRCRILPQRSLTISTGFARPCPRPILPGGGHKC